MSKTQRTTRLFFASIISITALACGPSSAGSPPSPNIPTGNSPELPKPISTEIASWKLQPSSADHHYLTISNARLKLTDSSTVSEESIISRIEFKISSARETPTSTFLTTIDSFSLEGGSRTRVEPLSFTLPISLIARFQDNKLQFSFPDNSTAADCTNPVLSTLSIIQRTLVTPPLQLHTGMTWNDSTAAEVCSGEIPVSMTSSRKYRVLGATMIGNTPVILIERHDRSSSTGEGSSGQHRIALQSETIGSGQIAINQLTGTLVDDLSTYETLITIRASGRNQKFTQLVKEHTTLK